MSSIHIRHIKQFLEKEFRNLIDLSDLSQKSDSDTEPSFFPRSLAAFAVMVLGNTSPKEAANSVTDGYKDNGIDAIYNSANQKTIYIIQSKWSERGRKTIDLGETCKFIDGFEDLVSGNFENFNSKILKKKAEIESALNDANTHYKLIVIYTGSNALPKESQRKIEKCLNSINDTSNVASYDVLSQSEVHKIISKGLDHNPIDIEIVLYDWVKIGEPFESFYGSVSAQDVAKWREDYYPKIFDPNIRVYLGNTDINDGIIDTLKNHPSFFWYYNNGVTALCKTIRKTMKGGNSSRYGSFECKDFHIINGAQTVGSVYEANKVVPEQVGIAKIPIRIISLENCPEDFSKLVTKYNNTQNKIDRRDFVALDPEQERIKDELRFEDIIYVYKAGEVIPNDAKGFSLEDATVALACSQNDITLSIRAKDKIGTLWDDINKAPYKKLFNGNTSSLELSRLVKIMKMVESTLIKEQKNSSENRRKLFATHASKLILYLIFQDKSISKIKSNPPKFSDDIEQKTVYYLDTFFESADSLFPNSYPANICRNKSKCEEIVRKIYEKQKSE